MFSRLLTFIFNLLSWALASWLSCVRKPESQKNEHLAAVIPVVVNTNSNTVLILILKNTIANDLAYGRVVTSRVIFLKIFLD